MTRHQNLLVHGSVIFSAPAWLSTAATLSTGGDYVVRLTCHERQLSSSDDPTVTLHPKGSPILSVRDQSAPERHDGGGAARHATLSKFWSRPSTVDLMTSDGPTTAPCDYGNNERPSRGGGVVSGRSRHE